MPVAGRVVVEVIPVIDIQHGRAVAAVAGDRANYRPLLTRFCTGSAPQDLARGLLGWHPFETLYIADLDGIEGRGSNLATIAEIGSEHPAVSLWVDHGARTACDVAALLGIPGTLGVIGTETGITPAELDALTAAFGGRIILSLDFKRQSGGDETSDALGTAAIVDDPGHWTTRVIAMTLDRVGSRAGPDLARLDEIRERAGWRRIYAAGGVRNRYDLDGLARAGVAGALVSTALHEGTITADDLIEVTGRRVEVVTGPVG